MRIVPVGIALIGAISYLSYHAVAGKQGLSSWSEMQLRESELEAKFEALKVEQSDLRDKVRRLYDESLDEDYLEELARIQFHFVYQDEYLLEPPATSAQLPENEDLFTLSNSRF